MSTKIGTAAAAGLGQLDLEPWEASAPKSAPQLLLYIASALPAHACGLVVTPEWAAAEKETGGEDMP